MRLRYRLIGSAIGIVDNFVFLFTLGRVGGNWQLRYLLHRARKDVTEKHGRL